jgi:hypothetical protein
VEIEEHAVGIHRCDSKNECSCITGVGSLNPAARRGANRRPQFGGSPAFQLSTHALDLQVNTFTIVTHTGHPEPTIL